MLKTNIKEIRFYLFHAIFTLLFIILFIIPVNIPFIQ